MPRKCNVCEHPDRAGIEFGLANHKRGLAKRYGLSPISLQRHRRNHMSAELQAGLMTRGRQSAADLENIREAESEGIVQTLVFAKVRIFRNMDKAELEGNHAAVARFVAELHRNVELMAKIVGELPTGNQTINNIMLSPQFGAWRSAIVYALRPFPEAQAAVVAALQSIETHLLPAIEMH